MSIQAIAWVLEQSQSKLAARLVMISIANHASHEGDSCWPSIATIARESGLSERAVQAAIRELEELGELAVRRTNGGRGKTNRFALPAYQQWAQNVGLCQKERVKNVHPFLSETVKSTTEKGEYFAPKPSYNRQTEKISADTAPNYKNFAVKYCSLTGRHPTRGRELRDRYDTLCARFGEDAVLAALEVWAESRGGADRLRRNRFAVSDFLHQEAEEILLSRQQQEEQQDDVPLLRVED